MLQRDEPPLVIVRVDAHAVAHGKRRVFGIDGRTGIAFFIGIIPVRLVSRKLQVQLPRLHLGLLQAEEIGVQFYKDVGKAFARHRPKAVYVPGDEFEILHFVQNDRIIPKSRWRRPWCP